MSAVSEGQTTSTSNNLQRSRPDTGKQTKRKSSVKQDNWRPLMMAANSNRMTTKAGASTSTSAEAATAAKLPQASPSSSSSSSGCSSPPNSSQKRTTTATSSNNNNKGNNLNNPNLLSPNSNEQQPSTHLAAPSAGQYRRKSTLSGNGFFIDYSCTRRRSSAAIQAARLAEQRDSIITRNQFLRTCMSPGAAAGRQRRPSSMVTGSSSHTAVAGNQQPAPNRHRSFCAGGPTAATSNSAGNSPARTNSRSSYSAGTTSHHLLPAANLLHVPAALSLAGSRKTSIFDPVGHSLAAGAAHLRRKSTMTSTGLTPAVEQAATMLTVARNAAALTRGGQPKARCELVQRVPVIGCSPTSIRASLAALDETRRYEKLLRKLKKHQKHKLKRRQQLEGRHGRDFLCGSDPDHSNSQSDCDRGSSSGGSWSLSPSEGSPLRSRAHNQPGGANNNNLRRKSIRAVKEMATLVNKAASEHLKSKRRAHRRARGQDPFVDGLSISSTLSFASSHTSLPSIDRFLDQYERALYEASSDSCQEDDYEFEQEDADDDDELFVIVNDHNDNEHTGDTGGGAGEQTSQAKRLERPGTKRASIVRKAMRKLASTITRGAMGATSSQSQHQLGQTSCKQQDEQVAIMHQQRQPSTEAATDDAHANSKIGCQTRAEAAKQQQQRATSSSFRQNHQRPRRRSVSMSGGLNYWHYYYYLRANSLEAVDDLPVQVGPIGGGDLHASNGSTSLAGGCGGSVMSESERRARLYINYSLARLDILNSNSDPVARLADKLASIQQCQVESSCWSIGPNNTNTHTTNNNNATNTPNEQFVQSGGANQATPASQWRQLFDFSQSTDVSLTLSTSSTSLQQSSTSRNSSSLSSPVSTVSSPGPHLDSSAHSWNGSAGSSASLAPSAAHHLARPTSSTPTGHNVYHHHQAGPLTMSAPRPAHSVSSQSVRSVGQNQYLQGHQQQQQHHLASSSQHYLSVAAPSTSSNKWQQQDHQMHAYLHGQQPFGGSRGRQSGELELRYSHGNLLLDSPASRQIDHDQQHDERRRASTKISGKTNNNSGGGGGNLSGQPDVDHVYEQISGEHVAAGGGGGGGGLGGVGLSASSAAAAATSATKQATNEEELDDFERFNRCYKPLARQAEEQRAARQLEQAAPTRMGRDSHFRLSVKSLRAPSGRSPAKVVGSGEGRAGLGAGLAAGGVGGQSEPRQGPRAFLSWDTLTSPTLVADTRPSPAQDVSHLQWPTTTAKTTTPPGAPQQQQQRQQLSSPIGSVMQKDEDLSNLGRRRREAASRRSFRQPRSTCWSSAVGPGRLSASSYHQAANGAASAPTNTSPLNRRTRDEHNNDQQRQRDEDDDNNNNKQCWKTTETTTSANSNKDDHHQQERKGSSSLQLQFEAQMSEAANLAARAAVADLHAPLDIKTNNAEAKVGRREASKGDTSASYYHESAGGYCDLCDQAVGARCSSSGFLLFPSSSSALDRSAGLDDEPDNNARRQQHHLGPSGRARSQSNIVNLVSSLSSSSSAQPAPLPSADRTNHLGLSGAAMGARLGLPQPDNPLGRRCTSASLRVPKWRQQRDCEQADINSELKQQQQQLHPAGPRQQPLNASATAVATSSSSCNSLSAGGPKMAATTSRNHISALGHPHHDDYDVHSSDRDQPRARAHSTGAGGAAATGDHLSPRLVAAQVVREAHSELPARPANTNQQMSTIASSETHLNLVITSTTSTTTNHKQHKSSSHLLEREQRNLCLLRKNSFNCMVVGARQTGKRTIVKCFVKLLNEFKLAADEYKKEKMLSKLMECSERLNELQSQQEAAAAAAMDSQEAQERHRRRSRLNSWLPGTNTVNKLLHFSPKNKQRLHSVVGIWAPQSDQENATSGHKPAEQQQRRHTTFGPHNSTEMTTVLPTTSGSSRFLNVDNAPTRPTIQTCATNKSDSELNNQQTTSFTVHQLKVPALHQTPALRKHSDTTGHSSGGHFLSADEDASKQTSNNGARRNTDAAAFSWRGSGEPIEGESSSRGQGGGTNANAPLKPTNLTSAKRRMSSKAPQRKHSIVGLSRRRRRMLLSLKELNGRRCGIKFKTRRQISESCLEQLKRPVLEDIKRRASIMATNKNSLLEDEAWPDSFLVVYSINDRDSFEYAKTLIGQLRANKQDVPLPIILVANKIDLERVRMVKREEGRTLARKNTCKFIELSCTVGFNLDNLLVGLRTQLILRHHIILNSILRGKSPRVLYKAREIQRKDDTNESGSRTQQQQQPHKGSDNILIRFYKRYVMDNSEQDYDCDNFSKL